MTSITGEGDQVRTKCVSTKCVSKQCKYTIQNYRSASKYFKTKIINYLKENKIEFYLCRICSEIVNKSYFDSEENNKKFNSVCDIEIKNLFKKLLFQSKVNLLIQDITIYIQIYILKNI